MNKLSTARRAQVVAALVEGNSVRATCRMTGVDKGAVLKLLVDLGAASERYQDETLRNLKLMRIQCNHKAAVALHFMHYNFARVHQTLRVTPAMEAGVSDHVWSIAEIVGLLDRPSA